MKIDSEEEAIFIAERKEWGGRSVSKLNRPIQLSAVGAGFTCPKTPYELNDSIIHVLTHHALLDSQCIINTLKSFRALYSLKSLIL